jgi:predicted NodU family carbamoyl transferase
MYILGINAYHGDAAAAVIKDGRIVAAAEEERFNRVKHCAGFPASALRYCLAAAGITIEGIDHIGISRDPSAHLHKKILFAASRAAKETVGRRQKAGGGKQDVGGVVTLEEGAIAETGNGGNGRAPGIFAQIKDRLSNAARVRDLNDDLARALGVEKNTIRA